MSNRTPLLRRTGTIAAALLALTGLAACSNGGDDDSTAPKQEPTTQTTAAAPDPGPATDACYSLPYDAALAPTSTAAAVDCGQPHTSVTFAVGTIDAVLDGHLLAVDSERVQAQVSTACPAQLLTYVGGTLTHLRLSMIRSIWFTPTVEQSDAGASWYRCDAVLLDGASKLAELDGDLSGVLGGKTVPDQYAMCGTAAPDAPAFERVRCSAKHSWRAIDVVAFDETDYPGAKVVQAAGRTKCEDAAAGVAEDPLTFKWGYEWPTKEQWAMGQRFGRCWTAE
ncbi:septum formation family protein [Nocardioides daeguensis]|uniref:Septum formation-related domain-containing protein n=1 Tax=Nocardioides daeguensis TaxID=908359 RepID=A0ABP6VKV4_9ACTN|nr:septum formation family protein [Nocardioides daeguensis]MBV6727459.1 septum formation family protein [Nocardioides daeguensis]MCR1773319.1 septum formation family protein [Nocardioides daeguensis]